MMTTWRRCCVTRSCPRGAQGVGCAVVGQRAGGWRGARGGGGAPLRVAAQNKPWTLALLLQGPHAPRAGPAALALPPPALHPSPQPYLHPPTRACPSHTPRGRMHRERDPELWYRNRCLDMKYVGVPGERRVDGTASLARGCAGWGGAGRGLDMEPPLGGAQPVPRARKHIALTNTPTPRRHRELH